MRQAQRGPRLNELSADATNNLENTAPVVVFGGAGFIGSNLADHLLECGERVRVVDNLSRAGVERNLDWLARHQNLEFVMGDVRDASLVERTTKDASFVYHLAAQVAVTISLEEPLFDLEVNTLGTLNILEALRRRREPPGLIFTSTNKVYGTLPKLALEKKGGRCVPVDPFQANAGIDEEQPLDLVSPYGCSKGAADQYVLDYARWHGLAASVFRMSCIYGPRQFGNEDQGWVAHFLLNSLRGRPITIYGDGYQVRDLLYVSDLVDALVRARSHMPNLSGRAFNVGGGPARTVSLLELVRKLENLLSQPLAIAFKERRLGDQDYFAANHLALSQATGWSPRVDVDEGLVRLKSWLDHLLASDAAFSQAQGEVAHA